MQRSRLLAAAALSASLGLLAVAAPSAGDFTKQATVTRVIGMKAIEVRLVRGKMDRVRLIGIESPEVGACWSLEASADMRELTSGKVVWLVGDATQAARDPDRYLLAYVVLAGGSELGLELIKRGDAKVDVRMRRFKQLATYRKAQADAEAASAGLWGCGGHSKPAKPEKQIPEKLTPEKPTQGQPTPEKPTPEKPTPGQRTPASDTRSRAHIR
jgi:micrococcal nuclease